MSLVILIKYILIEKNIFNKNNEAEICEIRKKIENRKKKRKKREINRKKRVYGTQ